MRQQARHPNGSYRRQHTKHRLHPGFALFIEFKSSHQFLGTFITKCIGNNDNNSVILRLISLKVMLIEIFLFHKTHRLHRLICKIYIPFWCQMLQVCIGVDIFYSFPYIRKFVCILDSVIGIIKPSVIGIYQIRFLLVIIYQYPDIAGKFHQGN